MPEEITDEIVISAGILPYVLSQLEELDEKERQTLLKLAVNAYIDGAVEAHDALSISVDFNLVHKAALDYTEEYRDMLVNRGGSFCAIPILDDEGFIQEVRYEFIPWAEEYSAAQRELVADTIKKGIEEGLSVQNMAKELDQIFDAREKRAELLVQTEARKHNIAGIKNRYKSHNVQMVEWSTAGSDVCPICMQLQGERYPIDDIPGSGPPIHVRCRCRLVPVIDLEAEIAAMEI